MRTLLRHQKPICLIVLVSLYWLCMPQIPAQGAMINTEDTLERGSKADFDRARIKAFVSRKDVIAQLQSYGISSDEALVRVNSLTDQEISLIAGKLDQLSAPAGGAGEGAYYAVVWPYMLIAALIIGVIILIIDYAWDGEIDFPDW